jgi:hypothetical protein
MKYHPTYEVIIHAPIADVWSLLENFENYASWNSMITFKGQPKVGSKTPMKVSIMGRNIVTPVKFLKIQKEKALVWKGGPTGFITGEHYFKLEAIDEKTTRMIQGEKFKGILVPVLWPVLKGTLNTLYEQTNKDIINAFL